MITVEARRTLRGSGILLAQRSGGIAAGMLFAALVPRLFGPASYGQYTLLMSLVGWFVFLTSPGFGQVLGRFGPRLLLRGEDGGLRELFVNLLALDVWTAVLSAATYLLLTTLWLRELDRVALAAMAGAVLVRSVATVVFLLNLGLNRAGRWGTGEFLRLWASLGALLVGYRLVGLRGACLGLLLAELAVLAVGLAWARGYLSRATLRPNLPLLAPYLRFGLQHFAVDVLYTALIASGGPLMRVVGAGYAQVGFFGLAYSMYLAVSLAVPQLTFSFIPLTTNLLAQGDPDALKAWLERLLKWLSAGAVVVVLATLFLAGDAVPLVLGRAFQPAAAILTILMLSLVATVLSAVAGLLVLTYNRPVVGMATGGLRLALFWGLGVPLAARWGGQGAAAAMLASLAISGAYLTWRMRALAGYSLRGWALAMGSGLLFAPLLSLRSSLAVDAALCAAAIVGYGGMLLLLRVIRPAELAAAWRVLRRAGGPPPVPVGSRVE